LIRNLPDTDDRAQFADWNGVGVSAVGSIHPHPEKGVSAMSAYMPVDRRS